MNIGGKNRTALASNIYRSSWFLRSVGNRVQRYLLGIIHAFSIVKFLLKLCEHMPLHCILLLRPIPATHLHAFGHLNCIISYVVFKSGAIYAVYTERCESRDIGERNQILFSSIRNLHYFLPHQLASLLGQSSIGHWQNLIQLIEHKVSNPDL